MEGAPLPGGDSGTHLMSRRSPWTPSLRKGSMEVACLLLKCLPLHLRANHVANLVAKGAGKRSS